MEFLHVEYQEMVSELVEVSTAKDPKATPEQLQAQGERRSRLVVAASNYWRDSSVITDTLEVGAITA